MKTYCLHCLSENEMQGADMDNIFKICHSCKATYKWPTSGYSYNVPSANKNNTNPNDVGKYPQSTGKPKAKNGKTASQVANPKSHIIPAPQI